MACIQVAHSNMCASLRTCENAFQLEAALAASLQREQALLSMVEQQRAEIDRLRSMVNALQLSDVMRGLDVSPGASPHVAPHHAASPPSVDRLDYALQQWHLQ